jgi:hypothetical protein
MKYATALAIVAIALLSSTEAATSPVTFESPCECRNNHGKHRWSVKNYAVRVSEFDRIALARTRATVANRAHADHRTAFS